MNIWERKKRVAARKAVKCKGDNMTLAYRIYKSIELYLRGEYDYEKYGYLKKIGPKSFEKESGDLKMAVRAIALHCKYEGSIFNMSIIVACHHLLDKVERTKLTHKYKYGNLEGKEYMVQKGKTDKPFSLGEDEGWLTEDDSQIKIRFYQLCKYHFTK